MKLICRGKFIILLHFAKEDFSFIIILLYYYIYKGNEKKEKTENFFFSLPLHIWRKSRIMQNDKKDGECLNQAKEDDEEFSNF